MSISTISGNDSFSQVNPFPIKVVQTGVINLSSIDSEEVEDFVNLSFKEAASKVTYCIDKNDMSDFDQMMMFLFGEVSSSTDQNRKTFVDSGKKFEFIDKDGKEVDLKIHKSLSKVTSITSKILKETMHKSFLNADSALMLIEKLNQEDKMNNGARLVMNSDGLFYIHAGTSNPLSEKKLDKDLAYEEILGVIQKETDNSKKAKLQGALENSPWVKKMFLETSKTSAPVLSAGIKQAGLDYPEGGRISEVDRKKYAAIDGIDFTQLNTDHVQKWLIEIAKISARQGVDQNITDWIKPYLIDTRTEVGQKGLIEILKIAAGVDYGDGLSPWIKTSGIDPRTKLGQEGLVEIAKIAANINGSSTSREIKNYQINSATEFGKQALFEIAKIAAKNSGEGTSAYIQNYGIDPKTEDGKKALIEIAMIASSGNSKGFYKFYQQYQIEMNQNTTPEFINHLKHLLKSKFVGLDSQNFCDWLDKSADKKGDHVLSYLSWVESLITVCTPDKIGKLFSTRQDLIDEISQCPPELRLRLTNELRRLNLDIPKTITKKQALIPQLILESYDKSIDDFSNALLASIQKGSFYKDGKKSKILIEALLKIKTLEVRYQEKLIKFLGQIQKPVDQLKALSLINALMLIEGQAAFNVNLLSIESLENSQHQLFKDKFDLTDLQDFDAKYEKTIGISRRPDAWSIYGSTLGLLEDEEGKEAHRFMKVFVSGVLNETFNESRYELKGNDLLTAAAKKMDIECWKRAVTLEEGDMQKGEGQTNYKVTDSDKADDFLLMGTEVLNSCQHIEETTGFNQCILGYALDGKHRLSLIVDEKTNKILARAVLRLFINEEGQPVLFQEKIYFEGKQKPEYLLHLRALATKKAEALGIPLVIESDQIDGQKYISYKLLSSGQKPTPFEYVDMVGGVRAGDYSLDQGTTVQVYSPENQPV